MFGQFRRRSGQSARLPTIEKLEYHIHAMLDMICAAGGDYECQNILGSHFSLFLSPYFSLIIVKSSSLIISNVPKKGARDVNLCVADENRLRPSPFLRLLNVWRLVFTPSRNLSGLRIHHMDDNGSTYFGWSFR